VKDHNRRHAFPDGSVLQLIDLDGDQRDQAGAFLADLFSMATAEMRRDGTSRVILADGRKGATPCFLSYHRNQPDPDDNGWMLMTASRTHSQAAFIVDYAFNQQVLPSGPGEPAPMHFHFEEAGWQKRMLAAVHAWNSYAVSCCRPPLQWPGLPAGMRPSE